MEEKKMTQNEEEIMLCANQKLKLKPIDGFVVKICDVKLHATGPPTFGLVFPIPNEEAYEVMQNKITLAEQKKLAASAIKECIEEFKQKEDLV
ncbi:MAG: hypothetical protein K9N21_10435 [Deltaproteobacteria bacterium]|nr:hypothetical protein [Deltaproteobacteria bacterium]